MKQSIWSPTESASFWINRLSRAVVRAQDEALKSLGFSVGQLPVFRYLKDEPAVSLMDLARGAGVEPPSMTQLIARMERDGIVRRVPNPSDGRSALVSLTNAARKKLPAAQKALMDVEKNLIADLSQKEVEALVALLRRAGVSLGLSLQEP